MSESLHNLTGLPWLVAARNEIQSLMLRLHQRRGLDPNTRQFAIGAAFSLWRAVFLIANDDTDRLLTESCIGTAADEFLRKVIETNNIGFIDEWTNRTWSGGYYVNNAMYRLSELTDGFGRARSFAGPMKLRDAWIQAFEKLDEIVEGPGTTGNEQSTGSNS
jgi:hypothetical protein